MSFTLRYVRVALATTDVRAFFNLEIPATNEIHEENRNHDLAWTNIAKLGSSKFSYLDQWESCLACQPSVSSLRWKWVPLKWRCHLSLTTGPVDQSKKAWKSSALNHIHTLLALVHTTLTFWNYVPQTNRTSYLDRVVQNSIKLTQG